MKSSDVIISVLVLGIVMIIIIPLPTWLMDALLIINITISLFILLAALLIKDAL
jgi:flagellar biosynthesis protein FlhA